MSYATQNRVERITPFGTATDAVTATGVVMRRAA